MALSLMEEPKRFGRYRLLGHIADGGMASVHLAQLRADHQFTKWVAMKVVHPRHAGEERFEKMFLSEARLAAQIDHPHVAQVFDCGSVDGTCYLAMEYMSGQTLHALLHEAAERGTRLPLGVVARIVANTALGLHAAHEVRDTDGELAGIVHRDISPQNIFVLYSGSSKLMDFGIAYEQQRAGSQELTAVGELKGKFAYMSPEQLVKDPLDRRSDIFSLGVVLWEATTGMRLFKRRTEAETAMAVMTCEVPRPSELIDDFPPELEAIVLRALARERGDRFQTAQDFAAAIEGYLAQTNETAGTLQVARCMADFFPTGKDDDTSTLRRATVLLDSYEDVLTPVTVEAKVPEPSFSDYDLLEVTRAAKTGARRRRAWPVLAVVLGAGAVFAAWVELREPPPAPEVAEPPSIAEAPAAAESPAAEMSPEPVVAEPAPEPAPVSAEAATQAVSPEPPAPEPVRAQPRRRAARMSRPRAPEVAAPPPTPRPPPASAMEPRPTGPRPMTEFE